MSNNTTVQKKEQELGIIMPAVTPEQALEAWNVYQDLKNKIVDRKNDVQTIQGKDFLKKSYWRKVATFFNLTVKVVDESHEAIGKTVVWHFTCEASHKNGRSAIGTGSCDSFEKATLKNGQYLNSNDEPATPNSLHNIRSTAETRAFNRAVSNLVGGGEVSAEEVNTQNNQSYVDVVNEPSGESSNATMTCPQCGKAHKGKYPKCFECWKKSNNAQGKEAV